MMRDIMNLWPITESELEKKRFDAGGGSKVEFLPQIPGKEHVEVRLLVGDGDEWLEPEIAPVFDDRQYQSKDLEEQYICQQKEKGKPIIAYKWGPDKNWWVCFNGDVIDLKKTKTIQVQYNPFMDKYLKGDDCWTIKGDRYYRIIGAFADVENPEESGDRVIAEGYLKTGEKFVAHVRHLPDDQCIGRQEEFNNEFEYAISIGNMVAGWLFGT